MKKVVKVRCPGCKKEAVYGEENPYRPFCGRLCAIEDTAAWASEDYKIPTTEPVDLESLPDEGD